MSPFDRFLDLANAFLWQNTVLFIILGTGIVFTIWSRFCQFRAHKPNKPFLSGTAACVSRHPDCCRTYSR